MTTSPSNIISGRLALPDELVRGADCVLEMQWWRDATQLVPASAAVTIFRPDGTKLVTSAAAIVDGSGTATYTVAGAASSGEDLGEMWRVEWAAVIAGKTVTMDNEAALVRRRMYPSVTDADLFRRQPSFDPSNSGSSLTTIANFQPFLDEAWVEIMRRIYNMGKRPALVMSRTALRGCTLNLWIALVFEALAARKAERFESQSVMYRGFYEREWAQLTFSYDEDADGVVDSTEQRRKMRPTVALVSRGRRWRI